MQDDTRSRVVTVQQLECKKCGHKWLPRSLDRPVYCPSCKSGRWDRKPKPKNRMVA